MASSTTTDRIVLLCCYFYRIKNDQKASRYTQTVRFEKSGQCQQELPLSIGLGAESMRDIFGKNRGDI